MMPPTITHDDITKFMFAVTCVVFIAAAWIYVIGLANRMVNRCSQRKVTPRCKVVSIKRYRAGVVREEQ